MKNLSLKLGLLFFLILFGLETFTFFFLHSTLVESRVEEELIALQTRGNSHRAILERHFDNDTISHVALMESEANTDVVITNINKNILGSSVRSSSIQEYIDRPIPTIPREGQTIGDNWTDEDYISTVSPIEQEGQLIGHVYMFQDTAWIQSLISRLNEQFLLAGFIAVIFTITIIIFLSKALAKPLIKMKEATSQISKGDFSVSLPKTGNDELGDLAKSIQLLANDLSYLKEERSEFLSSISHELRTPLTYIKGYADIVQKRNLTAEERNQYLSIILEETNRLSDMVKNLFDLAKIDKNSFDIHKTPIDLNDFMRKIEAKFTPAFMDKRMILVVNCPEAIQLNADASRLEQIIFNLLDNSIKYSSPDGKTAITVSRHKKNINIRIKDNGKGIPEHELPYIFNRFYRVDKSRTRALGGTGLGLAIVKELIHAHGGTITVKSKENIGTEFEMVFKGDNV
ncbi:HAMP domain-containing histidine kinase [Bacillus sp. ISL-47]|uniref:HAMP domain-containing sensor histidine kinase n=1 Tax=Bacillus sp. ISL-47 TaxID=2819130 RepID=UPI001BEAAEF1|nr:HAMP domain-containing sensor histidine kinase [Bacillus sp. ISL-47]MBT2690915.1 HAMP domain-containing histidine kinase [Bacillus sp. ISL-47]MBT2710663.1 HAMP domain-containing histidine kinase [Pseudomonas sp. ISL-84]